MSCLLLLGAHRGTVFFYSVGIVLFGKRVNLLVGVLLITLSIQDEIAIFFILGLGCLFVSLSGVERVEKKIIQKIKNTR